MSDNKNNNRSYKAITEQDLKRLLDIVETISYGSVTLVIQDGKVIQIERNEKVRLK